MQPVVEEMREAVAFIVHWEREVTLRELELIAFRAQAYSLAADGRRVFDEPIRVQGGKPVVEELRHEFGRFGEGPITGCCDGVKPGLRGEGPWWVGAACLDSMSEEILQSAVPAGLDCFLQEQEDGAIVGDDDLQARAAELIEQARATVRADQSDWGVRLFVNSPESRAQAARGMAEVQAGLLVRLPGQLMRRNGEIVRYEPS